MNGSRPNLFIVGAPKCGTTSIYHYLKQSPEIFLSQDKEPHFLAFDEDKQFKSIFGDTNSYKSFRSNPYPVTEKEKYHKLFKTNNDYKYKGEASTLYLYSKYAPQNIYDHYNDDYLSIIMLLRNPVERAYSQFLHHVRDDLESTDNFIEAFKNEKKRLERGPFWHYRKVGLYSEQVKRYYELFGKEKVMVIKFEDFKRNTQMVKRNLCSFLKIEPIKEVDDSNRRYNATGYPKKKFVQKILLALSSIPFRETVMNVAPSFLLNMVRQIRQNNLYKPELGEHQKRELMEFYSRDIEELENITGISFAEWKT